MASKELMGGIGGALAGYFVYRKKPVVGAIVGYFAGFLIGRQLDKSAATTQAAITAGQGAGITSSTVV